MSTVNATSEEQFKDTPSDWARRWSMEFTAADKKLDKFWKEGDDSVKRFLDDPSGKEGKSRLNIFTANVRRMRAILFGNTPKVSVSRRFDDQDDDVARVASEILERILNTDIERDGDGFSLGLDNALGDRLRPGLGVIWMRYEREAEQVPGKPAMMRIDPATGNQVEVAPEVLATENVTEEDVKTDYVFWRDFKWSPCRTVSEMRWAARKAYMSREDCIETFGDDGKSVPLDAKHDKSSEADANKASPWSRAEVWEIWDKEHERLFWYVDGYPKVLTHKDNPRGENQLGLEGFWSFPEPLMANVTTSGLIPKSDYSLSKKLYEEIDDLNTRINLLIDAVKVAGVYDKTNESIKRLLSERAENVLIPVEKWAAFAEKGGLKGVVDWLPLDTIVAALEKLEQQLALKIQQLDQLTGMSDIVRGEANQPATATEQAIKARFASVELQDFQKAFARFATDGQKIRKEIIAKHFSPQTIIERSNIALVEVIRQPGMPPQPNMPLIMKAVQLIKDRHLDFRVIVAPEQVSLTDYAALKQERTDVITAIAQFVQTTGPLMMQFPPIAPGMLRVLQWLISGLKGASEIESTFDQMIAQAEQAALQPKSPPPPDPKLQVAQVKAQADTTTAKLQVVNSLVDSKAQQAKAQTDIAKAGMDMQHAQIKHNMGMQSAEAKARAEALKSVNEVTNPNGGV